MAVQKRLEPTFVDMIVEEFGSSRRRAFYERMEDLIPWRELVEPIRALPEYQAAPEGGRPALDPEQMLKCIMAAKWNNLSDLRLEDELHDSLSLRRFVGLTVRDRTPDSTSFSAFRSRLEEAGLLHILHDRLTAHLEAAGVLVKEGTMVDATFIEAPKGGRRADGAPSRDPDAQYARKGNRQYFGYKLHVAADRSGIVTALAVTHANIHDGRCIDELTEHETVAVYADSAYHQKERRARLRARGVLDGIQYQRRRGQAALTPEQAAWNAMVAPIRSRAEHVFGRLKQMVGGKTRFRGMRSNRTHLALSIIAANMRQGVHLLTRAT